MVGVVVERSPAGRPDLPAKVTQAGLPDRTSIWLATEPASISRDFGHYLEVRGAYPGLSLLTKSLNATIDAVRSPVWETSGELA